MRTSHFVRCALSICLAAAVLEGCGSSRALGPAPVAPEPQAHYTGPSWTAAGLADHDLLYVTNGNGLVSVYRYWQHTLVGVLTKFVSPAGECVDKAQNVYITDLGAETVVEYAHGGKKPIATIDDSPYEPYACSVDPKTGNLAVANYETYGYSYNNNTGNIAIYPHGKGKPTYYGSSDGRFTSLAYDDYGDLLATDRNYYYYSFFYNIYFYYLPYKSSQLIETTLPNSQFSSGWPEVQSIAYDGTYWVVVSFDGLYEYSIDVKAQEIGEIRLSGGSGDVNEIRFYRKTPKAPATQVVGGGQDSENGDSFAGFWNYPSGGNPYYQITTDLDAPYGVAISRRK